MSQNPTIATVSTQEELFDVYLDWLSMTFTAPSVGVLLKNARHVIYNVLKFEAGPREEGVNYYRIRRRLFCNGDRVGFLYYGWNSDTASLNLTGKAFDVIYSRRNSSTILRGLYRFMVEHGKVITRADLCIDDFDGEFDVHYAKKAYAEGRFNNRGLGPKRVEYNAFGEGNTLMVGKQESGKLMCIYEKGKQLGTDDPWVRWELRVFSKGVNIPFDVIVNPGPYFRNSYPVARDLPVNAGHINSDANFMYRKKSSSASIEGLIRSMKNSYGSFVSFLREAGVEDATILNAICRKNRTPHRLRNTIANRSLTREDIIDILHDMTDSQ